MAKWPGKLSDRPIGELTGTGGAPRKSAWKRYSLSMYTAPQSPPSAGGRMSPVNLLARPDASMTATPARGDATPHRTWRGDTTARRASAMAVKRPVGPAPTMMVRIKRLAALDALTDAVSRADAADVAWLATDPVLFDRFVRIRGWSVGKFETWLTRTLTGQLLSP